MRRRGEVSSFMIITTVVLIVSFVILLTLLPALMDIFGDTQANRQACKLSVLARAVAVPIPGGTHVPLKCTTEKVCISKNGLKGSCEQFAGEKENRRGVRINLGNDKARQESAKRIIEREIADAMLSCWDMMGEGNADLWGQSGFTINEPKCVICSRIALDEDLVGVNGFEEVKKEVDVNNFMATKSPSFDTENPVSYYETMAGVGIGTPKGGGVGKGLDTDELAVIFSQIITKDDPWEKGSKTAVKTALVLGGAAVFTPAGKLAAANPLAAAIIGAAGSLGAGVVGFATASKGQDIAAIHCKDFARAGQVEGEAKHGCSAVHVVEWSVSNFGELSKICKGGFEGNL
jgi:hypothetical protein